MRKQQWVARNPIRFEEKIKQEDKEKRERMECKLINRG